MKFLWKKQDGVERGNAGSGGAGFFKRQMQEKPQIEVEKFLWQWELCRALFHSPVLSAPKMGAPPLGFSGAHHDIATGETWVDAEAARGLSDATGCQFESVLSGLMIRQISSYMDFPKSLSNALILEKMILDFCKGDEARNPEFLRFVSMAFSALAADACSVLDPEKARHALELRRAMAAANPGDLRLQLEYAYLQSQARQDVKPPAGLEREFEKLHTVDFSAAGENHEEMRRALMIWMEIARSVSAQEFSMPGRRGFGKGAGSRKGWGAGRMEVVDSDHSQSISQASGHNLSQALAQAASRLSRQEFEKVRKIAGEMKGEGGGGHGAQGIGLDESFSGLDVDASTVEYYLTLVRNYPLVIGRVPIETNGMRDVYKGTERFTAGSPPHRAMPFTSGGKILPGITRMTGIGKRHRRTLDYEVPNALILIDSSDTMPDPATQKSAPVAAGISTAISYLNMGGEVGVLNFGPKSCYLPFGRDEGRIFLSIVAKQHGGTRIDVGIVKQMLEAQGSGHLIEGGLDISCVLSDPAFEKIAAEAAKKEVSVSTDAISRISGAKPVDLFIFSDMKISNLSELLGLVEEREGVNRATIITNSGISAEELGVSEKIRVYSNVNDVEQSVQIAVGEARRAMGNNGE
ncbi:MAG: hypothetical protein WCT52_01690 [Candidatus Micrarchaeia archaeon]